MKTVTQPCEKGEWVEYPVTTTYSQFHWTASSTQLKFIKFNIKNWPIFIFLNFLLEREGTIVKRHRGWLYCLPASVSEGNRNKGLSGSCVNLFSVGSLKSRKAHSISGDSFWWGAFACTAFHTPLLSTCRTGTAADTLSKPNSFIYLKKAAVLCTVWVLYPES